jgi:tRNA(Ile)-lysidine synthase TilS/MesJ
VTFSAEQLRTQLAALEAQSAKPSRYVIAFSGGLDSTALAHALSAAETGVPIIAVHIDHGLHEDSASWSEHCNAFATSLGIEYRSRNVTVQLSSPVKGLKRPHVRHDTRPCMTKSSTETGC